ECILPFRHEIVGNAALPAVHGGVLGALLELTALLHLLDDGSSERVPKPITFSVDYLRAAGPSTTRARAEIFKLGRRIANVRVVPWHDDRSRPVVAGHGKCLLSSRAHRTPIPPAAGVSRRQTRPNASRRAG